MNREIRIEYLKRFSICLLGLFFYALGNFLGVKAGSAGTNAWNTLSLGLVEATGITFGTAGLIISFIVVLIDIIGKGKIGFGTLMNGVIISILSDVMLNLFTFIPEAPNSFIGAFYTLFGQVVISFATILYMKPALGCGPRDTLMVIVGLKLPKLPIGTVKLTVEIGVLLVGIVLGAPFGIGTVLVMTLQALIFQIVCKICRYEPRDIVHESFADTYHRFTGK